MNTTASANPLGLSPAKQLQATINRLRAAREALAQVGDSGQMIASEIESHAALLADTDMLLDQLVSRRRTMEANER